MVPHFPRDKWDYEMQHHEYKIHHGPLPDEKRKPDLLLSDPQVKKVTTHRQENVHREEMKRLQENYRVSN